MVLKTWSLTSALVHTLYTMQGYSGIRNVSAVSRLHESTRTGTGTKGVWGGVGGRCGEGWGGVGRGGGVERGTGRGPSSPPPPNTPQKEVRRMRYIEDGVYSLGSYVGSRDPQQVKEELHQESDIPSRLEPRKRWHPSWFHFNHTPGPLPIRPGTLQHTRRR